MFSKALFKQSCKANGTMWAIIAFAVCFMLACVMLISGGGNIGETKNAIQDTIIKKEIESSMEDRAIGYFENEKDGLKKFDEYFVADASGAQTFYMTKFLPWKAQMPADPTAEDYATKMAQWQANVPVNTETSPIYKQYIVKAFTDWLAARPADPTDPNYATAVAEWQASDPTAVSRATTLVPTAAYASACSEIQTYIDDLATKRKLDEDGKNELLASIMYLINPPASDGSGRMFDSFYTENGEESIAFSVAEYASHATDMETYRTSDERNDYVEEFAEKGSAIFLAGNITSDKAKAEMLDALSSYGVDEAKYDGFGYTYAPVKDIARKAVIGYRGRLGYELAELETTMNNAKDEAGNPITYTEEEKEAKRDAVREAVRAEESSSLLESLPEEVASALKDVGEMDLFSLVVGSIFYKLAGLLLPIIYLIMASNNLIAGQVDSGSMAYVLSTSTKRKSVVFTQAVYLIGSLLAIICLTTVTGCICLSIVKAEVELTYGKLVLINLGAFLVLFALSGLCYFTSCTFDRSKRAMAIGGGLSIFALVAAMLGLFGSQVIPQVVRLDSLNYFNYVTIISLFDVVSILDGSTAFIWKFAILFALGIAGYAAGAVKFCKKDLPL